MTKSTDILVIGGGVIGCSIAYFLRKNGIKVSVVEKGNIGAQASGAAVGLLAPIRPLAQLDAYKALLLAGMRRFPAILPELEAITGLRVTYEQTGTLRLLPLEKVAPTQAWVREWQNAGFSMQLLSKEELYANEPRLLPGVEGAVSIKDEAQVSPSQLVQVFAQAARELGAHFYENTEVVEIQRSDNTSCVTGVRTAKNEIISCGTLIIAAGAWSKDIGHLLDVSIPVHPVRGELIAVKQLSPPLQPILFDEGIFDEDIYLAPKPDGTIIIGSTKAHVGFDTSVSSGGILHLLTVATRLLPDLTTSSIHRTWAGLRPKTPRSKPIIGRVPHWNNVLVASGHGGFGITLSILTGEVITELIVTNKTPKSILPFLPEETY
ncbi:glycine oxidase ThiO [Ktedonobacter racemifer]|uniref:glycine oxidase n=1 Tax=Ktedonobacter racemifer DSM 44963 TaxID=485913 RepID=D6TPR4_KTERA|nr:glycine oxidase ThiO [Ktedonobacter racemifer]EFH85678.1 glycine oxidase ThiO [Ktedonobacter racemifer DSM 44963]